MKMKRISAIVSVLICFILLHCLIYVVYAGFGVGLPSVIKERVKKLDKKVEEKKTEKENHAPNTPSNPSPLDGATNQSININLSWSGGDPDSDDTVTYDVYFDTETNPSLKSNDQSVATYNPSTLSYSTTYYWKIVAMDNHGISASGEIWSFTTGADVSFIEKSWGTAGLIEAIWTGDAQYPQVAMDTNGNAIAVWYLSDGTRDNIWSNRYVTGTGWGTAELIETDNTGDAQFPQVAMDTNGNAIAVWFQFIPTRYEILSNRYVTGTGWGTAELIEDNTGDACDPQIDMDTNGNAIAVWNHFGGTRNNILSNRYVTGTGWGTAELIETDNTGDAWDPQVVIDTNGNAIAVWFQFIPTRYEILSNRYVTGTGWGTAELIEDNTGDAWDPQVVIDTNGNAIAVWYQTDGTRYNIWSNRYVTGTGWGTAELIEDNTGDAQFPQVAMDTNGNAIAVWYQFDGTRDNIWSNRYVTGTGWGTAELIETDNNGDACDPQIDMDTNGNAIAVWYQSDGTQDNIWANRYVVDAGWGTAELIETINRHARHPQVAIDTDGNAIAVWYQSDGTRDNIWSNRYE